MAAVELSGKVRKSVNVLGELRDPAIVKEVVAQLMDNALFKDSLLTTLGITSLHNQIRQLESRLDDMEQYSRRNCLKFRGIPETNDDENTDDIVLHVCNDILGVMVTQSDISRSHRVGPKNRKFSRDIIVRFISYRTRASVYQSRFSLFNKTSSDENGDVESHTATNTSKVSVNLTDNLYINEALTKARSAIFTKALYLKKQKIISSTWTSDGRIVIRENSGDKVHVTRLDQLSGYPDPPPRPSNRMSGIRTVADRTRSSGSFSSAASPEDASVKQIQQHKRNA